MESKSLVLAVLAVGCLAAAAGGSYLAVRQNEQSASSAISASGASGAPNAPHAPLAPNAPVTESEGVITPETAKPDTRTAEPPSTRPSTRISTPNRRADRRKVR